jgi:hypothetical protein
MDFKLAEACVSVDSYQLLYTKRVKIDMKKAVAALNKIGEVLGETKVVLLAKVASAGISAYEDGRVLVKNVDKTEAERVGRQVTDALEAEGAFI